MSTTDWLPRLCARARTGADASSATLRRLRASFSALLPPVRVSIVPGADGAAVGRGRDVAGAASAAGSQATTPRAPTAHAVTATARRGAGGRGTNISSIGRAG